jgi:glyoxylase-like metal-dependent hydrolase (beta-lactamase superfamily II)/rhodanese-related sulfurtransferase
MAGAEGERHALRRLRTVVIKIKAFVDEGLGHSSYLVDLDDSRALVVDPPRIPDGQLGEARAKGLAIAVTADTHSHADYVSGSPLLTAHGATFLAPRDAGLEVAHQGIAAGDVFELRPGLSLRAIATPGHTPEHLAYLLCEDGRPIALFSGGSLMVGTVGRTDLLGVELREDLARRLYRALRDEILTLPDDLAVYPTHGAGSFCSAPGAGERTTTIGHERATNLLLHAPDEDAFVSQLLAGFGTFPTYFRRLPEVNRRGPRLYDAVPALDRLDVERFQRSVTNGALVIDVRSFDEFAGGQVPGALSLALRPVFGSWLGWLVDPERPLVFVLDDEQDRADLVRQCLSVGYEHLVGELDGGMTVWRAAGRAEQQLDLVEAEDVHGTVLDVRQRAEYEDGHLPGAVHIELGSLADAVDQVEVGPLTVMCGHGERAMTGASILAAHGRTGLRVLAGGPEDWAAVTGQPLE